MPRPPARHALPPVARRPPRSAHAQREGVEAGAEIGHEAHFSQVMNMYLGWMKEGKQPADYLPNMLVKYYTLAEAWKASRTAKK